MKISFENKAADNAAEMVALMDVIEDLRQQNRELHDRLLAVYAPAAAQMTSQYELGRLQLQPVPPVPAVPTVSQPEPRVGA